MSSTTEQIKERLPIVEVISSYVKLERAGQNYKARCPFHNERTPSFIVSPSRNAYHCFGCNRGGDIFTFVEEIEGVEFKEALRSLAERAGVVLPRLDPKETNREKRAFQLLEEATRYFERNLGTTPAALEYLKERGLAEATIKAWRLGYAKNDWRFLLTHLKGRKWSEADIERAGLAIKGDKGYYDRFRGRIIFPIENAQGKIVGFSGRHFVPARAGGPGVPAEGLPARGRAAQAGGQTGAKYINSPETPLFNKSRILYGLSRAKQAMMKEDVAVLVEGQMDLLMSHQAGLTNTAATSGTALTIEHLRAIKRFTPNLVLAFDSDEAGFSASARGFHMAALSVSLGMNVKVAKLPEGADPAELGRKDPLALVRAVRGAKYIVDFYLDSFAERGYDERMLIGKVRESVLPLIRLIPSHMDRAHYVALVAKTVGLDEAHVWEEVKKTEVKGLEAEGEEGERGSSASREEKLREKIIGIIEWQETIPKKERKLETEKWKARYRELGKSPLVPRERKEHLLLQAEMYYGESDDLKKDIETLCFLLEQDIAERELLEAMKKLRLAELGKDEKGAIKLLRLCQEISRRINAVKQELKRL